MITTTPYSPKTFNLPTLTGISDKTVAEHLALYAGYVKHTNLILDRITEYSQNPDTFTYELNELQRRFSFEYNGMKNHEYYFEQLEGGARPLPQTHPLMKMIIQTFGGWDDFIIRFQTIALTRGIGWALLVQDTTTGQLLTTWVDEQHLGQLNTTQFIFGIDMWEHSYVADYQPSGKKQYVLDYLSQVNWERVGDRIIEI